MKKTIALLLAVLTVLLFASCTATDTPTENSADDDTASTPFVDQNSAMQTFCNGRFEGRDSISLVALGDSIARGYGLQEPETQAYPYILSKSIEAVLDGASVSCTNYAVDGMRTDGLLELLKDGAPKLSQADIVVISIGANNILGPFLQSLGVLGELGEGYEDQSAVESFINKLNGIIKSDKFAESMNAGIATAAKELPEIIKKVNQIAPDALVMISTVYSPYHGITLSVPYLKQYVDLGKESDKWVSLLNQEIRRLGTEEKCIIVESYNEFAETEGLVNASISLMPPRFSFDPHPNINGHIKLSNLYLKALAAM